MKFAHDVWSSIQKACNYYEYRRQQTENVYLLVSMKYEKHIIRTEYNHETGSQKRQIAHQSLTTSTKKNEKQRGLQVQKSYEYLKKN